jgi:anti-anti-sigma factor
MAGFQFTCDPPVARLRLSGEFDLSTHEQLGDVLACLTLAGCRRIDIDLAAVTFIDAGTLRVLADEQRRLARCGGALEVVVASRAHLFVCDLAGYPGLAPAGST